MRPVEFRLIDWILRFAPKAKYNLTSSGLSEPRLSAMGINTSFEDFAAEKDEHERLFAEAVAELYKVEPYNVVLTTGASQAIFFVYSVLGGGGAAVVPMPNYEPMFTIPLSLGLRVRSFVNDSPAPPGSICGLTDPNNPTGRSLGAGLIDDLSASFGRRKGTVFVNETYKEFTFPGAPRTCFQRHENIVTCTTMTKFYGLGRLRVGWILAGKKPAHELWNAERLVTGHNPEYSLWVARQALMKRGLFVKRARRICSENLPLVAKFQSETEGVAETKLGATPFCLVKYRKGPNSVTFARRLLRRAGVLVSPGDFFGAPKAFRLCFTSDRTTLGRGLGALSDYLRDSAR